MRTNFTCYLVLMMIGLFCCALGSAQRTDSKKFIVVLDAGHGGSDPGKPSKIGVTEKEVTLKIALQVGQLLEKRGDIKVIYTRKSDVFVDLFKRGEIANKAKADLFVSIHCNAHDTQASGAETFVLGLHRNKTNFEIAKAENEVIFLEDNYQEKYAQYDLNSPESVIGLTLMQEEFLDQSINLATLIQNNFRDKLKRKDRSVKQAGFIVLHQTVMPSVLVETGFITNEEEGRYLNSSRGQLEMASAIAEAITHYKENVSLTNPIGIDVVVPGATVEEVVNTENVQFRVQIAASSRSLEPKAYNFKGLEEVDRKREGKLYKYYYGSSSDYNLIERKLREAQARGYKSAYIVAFKNGVKTPVGEFLK